MVLPSIWGPPVWDMLFGCAWKCTKENFSTLQRLVDCTTRILPCELCRQHFRQHRPEVERRVGVPNDPNRMIRWLYQLKTLVNQNLRRPSIPFDDLVERFTFSENAVNDVCLADALVLFAYTARTLALESVFVEMSACVSKLIPLPTDSELVRHLARVREVDVVVDAWRAARATRIERGYRPLSIEHYRSFVDE